MKIIKALLFGVCMILSGWGSAASDLTGVWNADDGGTYYLRQVGNSLWWFGRSGDGGASWSNVFHGVVQGNRADGAWADVPMGRIMGSGEMHLSVVSLDRLVASNKSGGFGGSVWTRQGTSGGGSGGGGAGAAFCSGFSGRWNTNYGEVILQQSGSSVSGSYYNGSASIRGYLSGYVLEGDWLQTNGSGRFRFELARDGGSFTGIWGRSASNSDGGAWNGNCAGPVRGYTSQTVRPSSSGSLPFEFLDQNSDYVGEWGNAHPDGRKDGHFTVTLDLGSGETLQSLAVYSSDASGNPQGGQVWHSANSSYWILGVFHNGSQLIQSHVPTLGRFSGTVRFDLYCNDSGWFKPGQYFMVEAVLGNGSKWRGVTRLGEQPARGYSAVRTQTMNQPAGSALQNAVDKLKKQLGF